MVNLKLGSYCHTVLLEYMQVQSILTEILQIENCWLLRFAMNCKHRWNRFYFLLHMVYACQKALPLLSPRPSKTFLTLSGGDILKLFV